MTQKRDQQKVRPFDVVRIKDSAPYFRGREATVAYVGEDGISVALPGLDDYVPLKWSEFTRQRR